MKYLFFIIALFGTFSIWAQPVNDLCSNALDLPLGQVNTSPFYTIGNCAGATATMGIPVFDSVCTVWRTSRKDVWYKFSAPYPKGKIFFYGNNLSGYAYQIFKGNCSGMRQVFCNPNTMTSGALDSSTFYGFQPDTIYFLRVYNWSSPNLPSLPFSIGIKFYSSGKIFSKLTGGVWDVPATWVGNVAPTNMDSVEISEGSTVKTPTVVNIPIDCRWLKIGGSDSTKKAIFNQRSAQSTALGLILGKGDSIVSRLDNGQFNTNGVFFSISASSVINGGINARKVTLSFGGNSLLNFSGSGTIVQNLFGGFYHGNRGTTNFGFGGNTQGILSLRFGTLKFLKPIVYKLRAIPPSPLAEEYNYIERFAGTYEGTMTFEMPVDFILQKARIKYRYGVPLAGSGYTIQEDTLTRPGKEFINTKAMRAVTINRLDKNRSFTFDSTLSLSQLECLKGKIRMKNPSDTVFAYQLSMSGDSSFNGYCTQGHVCLWKDPNFGEMMFGSTDNTFAISQNGKVRDGAIVGNWSSVPGQKICPEIIPNPPSGPVMAPLTTLGGGSVLFINSTKPIPSGQLKIRLVLRYDDYLLANPLDLYIAQAPTPNGPWIAVSQPVNTTIKSRTTDFIDFANGRYFCWATSAQGSDLALTAILCPPKYFQTGCLDSPNQRVGIAVQNLAVTSVESYVVSYRMGNGEIKSQVITYPTNARLGPLKKDTIWFSNDLGQAIATPQMHTFTAWVHMNDDTLKMNDTLRVTKDYRIQPFPYFNRFDTISLSNSQFPLVKNIPYRWFDSLQYANLLKAGAGSMQVTSGKYFALNNVSATNRVLETFGMSRPLFHSQYTNPIGPIQKPALLELKFAVGYFYGNPISVSDMLIGDTVFVEGTEDCGYSWKSILKIHRGNRPLTEKLTFMRDSLTFSNGSIISLRLRMHFVAGTTAPLVRIDSLRLYPGELTVSNSTLTQNSTPQIYPNPTDGRIQVRIPESWPGLGHYEIFNMQGSKVQEAKLENESIELDPHLKNGVYWLRLIGGTRSFGERIILQR